MHDQLIFHIFFTYRKHSDLIYEHSPYRKVAKLWKFFLHVVTFRSICSHVFAFIIRQTQKKKSWNRFEAIPQLSLHFRCKIFYKRSNACAKKEEKQRRGCLSVNHVVSSSVRRVQWFIFISIEENFILLFDRSNVLHAVIFHSLFSLCATHKRRKITFPSYTQEFVCLLGWFVIPKPFDAET